MVSRLLRELNSQAHAPPYCAIVLLPRIILSYMSCSDGNFGRALRLHSSIAGVMMSLLHIKYLAQ
jgi:hypothetical protein